MIARIRRGISKPTLPALISTGPCIIMKVFFDWKVSFDDSGLAMSNAPLDYQVLLPERAVFLQRSESAVNTRNSSKVV